MQREELQSFLNLVYNTFSVGEGGGGGGGRRIKRELAACFCVRRRNVSVWSMGVCNIYYVRGVQRLQLTGCSQCTQPFQTQRASRSFHSDPAKYPSRYNAPLNAGSCCLLGTTIPSTGNTEVLNRVC